MKRKQPDPNCEVCGGTGETDVYGKPDETSPCICTIPDDSDDDMRGWNEGGSQPIRPIEPNPTNTNDTGGGVESPIQAKDLVDALQKTI